MLDTLRREHGALTIIEGGATGADTLAREWWKARHVGELITVRADWKKHGKAAGPIRNQHMVDHYKPELVVAFPGGRGTADMVRRAKAADVKVMEIQPAPEWCLRVAMLEDGAEIGAYEH